MRIMLLVDCYLPSAKSSAKLVHDLGIEFRDQGHSVTIVAPDDSLSSAHRVSVEDEMKVLRVRTRQIKGAPRVLRAWQELRLSSTIWRHGRDYFRDNPCDLIVFYSPTIFFSGLVRRLKAEWSCPAYLVLRDIFPQWAIDAGVLREGLIARFFRYHEQQQYAVADCIGVQSPANLDYFHKDLQPRFPRLEVLYNWTTLQEPNIAQTNCRAQWGLEGKVVFFYGGNMGVAQEMNNLLQLAERLRNEPQAHFLFVGEGSEVPRLQRVIAEKKLTNVSLRPAVSQTEYLGLLAEFDVGLISLDRQLRTQNFPGKLLGYLYHQLPVLASINPGNDLGPLLEAKLAGLVSVNGDDGLLAENALRLARSPELRGQLGRNGRCLLESTFSVTQAANQILQSLVPVQIDWERPGQIAA